VRPPLHSLERRPSLPMIRLFFRVTLVTIIAVATALLGFVGSASAHNTLLSTDPADGAMLDAAPSQISLVFGSAVPLETASVVVTDATGARTDVAGLSHGPAGDTEIVAALPAGLSGEITIRWRLVGPDGHPLSGRVGFIVASTVVASTTVPYSTPPAFDETVSSGAPAAVVVDEGDDTYSTPAAIRWLLRFGSYLAIGTLIGIVLTDRFVWPGAAQRLQLRVLLGRSLMAVAVMGFLQLLIVASDVSGKTPWSSLGSIDAAAFTDAGVAFVVRIMLAAVMWLLLCRMHIVHEDVRWTALAIAGIALVGTWAWAGHSKSQRWAELGVPIDIVHHTAAALWIGSLALVGFVATRELAASEVATVMGRLSKVAAASVGLVVVSGLLQSIRLVGGPGQLFAANHGKYLAAKLVVLAVMLLLANANRVRVSRRSLHPDRVHDGAVSRIRQSILIEFAIGVGIIGITAAMVVSPPATSLTTTGARVDIIVPATTTT